MSSLAVHAGAGRRNKRTALLVALLAGAMLGLGYAAVPLYAMFCAATGFNGTPRIAEGAAAPGEVAGRIVSVRFDSNVTPGMAWRFEPEERTKRVALGARQMIFFDATNASAHAITGRATFSVTPAQAAPYFVKVQCFCFTEQTLKPGESVRMPVVFYVDPAFAADKDARDVSEITLSYTFFPMDRPKAES